ncbi:MAG: CGNR zinc finger domain-containing protein, partial [Acidobacteriaceae bacterium]
AGLLSRAETTRLNALPTASQNVALREALELREMIARICYGWLDGKPPAAEDRQAVERGAVRCIEHQQLRWKGGRLVWEWKPFHGQANAPVLLLAQKAVDLLTADEPPRLHACASGTCRWLFLDTSRNRTRRWCNMKTCGNREKARRFTAAHRN